ncbi:MAG: hypothetical protein OEL75_03900, partial [Kiritimatiellaceae bacterium]|nr:hypothetical protein [Kiritimatiellaceae bacterium]
MTGLKSKTGRVKGLIKGAPTAVLVSIGIHLVLLFLATGLVVFHVVKNKEVAFVPPEKFDRPKMNLRKLRVKVKQDTKPKRSATRITTKTQTAMPDIQLPPMTGLGGGLGEDLGGFQVMADLSEMKSMGSPVSIGNDLVGTCYDMKRLKNGTENPLMPIKANDGNQHKFINLLHKFAGKDNNWDRKMLDKYYQSPKKLYATQFMVPPCASGLAPPQFGMSDQTVGSQWVAIYTGEIGLKDRGGRFRFWGRGDDHLFVRINGKLVLEGSHADRPQLNWQ